MKSITEVARDYNVSTRALRYYEEIGILHPKRGKQRQRLFDKKDLTRLSLLIRGKKFGFRLEEIKEMISLFDEDQSGVRQLETTISYGKKKIAEIEERINEFQTLKEDMEDYLEQFEMQLSKVRKGERK
ncbi:MerR family transcriptional regulator [Bacillus shivajii]|uniref:MerR family transcriptional regulator n=1 Tax=Bacillus shivajii TaxID=1983719 RepID=UPI001CF9A24C|nr:MerR family transcriptional regulator [Bacillus shivajii]UCZ54243.1 MerR family transcriptional regulator [Bacillus shivajii]